AAPHIANEDGDAIVVAIDAKHGQVYLQVFSSVGRTVVAPGVAKVRDAVDAASTGPARIVGSAASLVASGWPPDLEPPGWVDARDARSVRGVGGRGAAAPRPAAAPTPLYLRPPDARPQDAARLPRR